MDLTQSATIVVSIVDWTGSMLLAVIGGILVLFAAIFGLGLGLVYFKAWILNQPGGLYYNPSFGSGSSRFQKGKRNASGGINLIG